MIKRQTPSNQKRYGVNARSVLIAIIAIILFLVALSSVIGLFFKHRALRGHIRDLSKEEAALKEKQKSIKDLNKYIDTKDGQEKIFRDKYRLVKPKEGLIVITHGNESDYLKREKMVFLKRFWGNILQGLGLR